jgi:dUTP pyrophosphatase
MLNELQVRIERSELEPTRANLTDAGLDLRSKETVHLEPGKRVLVGTGVQVKIPPGYVGFLVPRSSLSKRNVAMTNSIGIIDSDYRGEIMASLVYWGSPAPCVIEKNERFAQLVIVPVALPDVLVRYQDDEQWNDTARGIGGFGSTGKH